MCEDGDPPVSDIFISYRSQDAGQGARQQHDILRKAFRSSVDIFLDDDDIDEGQRFWDRIEEELVSSKLMLAIAGKSYSTILRDREHGTDWVREELLLARQQGITIWPVWVDGAQPFTPDELPEAVRWLAELDGTTIRGSSSDDSDTLIRRVEAVLSRTPGEADEALGFTETTWSALLQQVTSHNCVPVIGTELGSTADELGPHPMALRRETGDDQLFSLLGGEDLPRISDR